MSENKPLQQCPICGAAQPVTARKCSICGAVLPGEPTPVRPLTAVMAADDTNPRPRFDPAQGADDLYMGDLSARMWRGVLIGGVVLALVAGLGLGLLISRVALDGGDNGGNGGNGDAGMNPDVQVEEMATGTVNATDGAGMDATMGATVPPTATMRAPSAFMTNTPRPTMSLPTVTPAPPTATITPTPGPCYQTAQTGDTVWGMAMRCGHRDMSVVDLILETNDMESANELQINQTLEIPWPTPTPGGEPSPAPADTSADVMDGDSTAGDAVAMQVNEFGTPDALAQYANMEPTLRPGLAWHSVQLGEDILSIAFDYGTDIETLSKINPEVEFLQCDYGSVTGGENCSVMIYQGQRIRVPVPLPTATLSPTPAGTLTPTPTPTVTYNAPYPITPDDGAYFGADQLVTLRWGGTGILGPDERYLVRVRDMDTGEEYIAAAREMVYILPGGWQPTAGDRHMFEWTISVVRMDANNAILAEDHITDPRRFTWESR